MKNAFDEISDKMANLFYSALTPEIKNTGDMTLLKKGMELLLRECRTALPSPIWDKIADAHWSEDASRILIFLKDAAGEWANAERCQLTLSDVEGDQKPGGIMLFVNSKMLETTSEYARTVEDIIKAEEFDLREWAHWCLLVGFLGLIMLEHIRPLEIESNFPETGTMYCVGIHDRIHLYLGIGSKGKFTIMGEWN